MRIALLAVASCALTSRAAPLSYRYFTPPVGSDTSPRAHVCGSVELGRVDTASDLRYPIEHRVSEVELQPYETLRWSERPEVFVKRSVERALFDRGSLEQALGGGGPVLDVDVLAFEETQQHAGRVRLGYALHDDTRVLAHGEITCERASTSQDIDHVVIAIGTALDEATSELARRVAAATCR